MTQEKLSFCRLAWEINGRKGHGEWFDIGDEKMLQSHVAPLNKQYGPGSHRIEYDDGSESYSATQKILKKVQNSPKAEIF